MKVLVVGAGPVGQVFGSHLTQGGARVHFLVRPGREPAVTRGFDLWRVRRFGKPPRQRFQPAGVVSTLEQVAAAEWDLALLCVSSRALRGPWLADLANAVGRAAVASVGQSAGDVDVVSGAFGADRTLFIVPSLFAWDGPLGSETSGPGVAYWLPPGGTQAIGGDEARVRIVAEALRRGGLRARHRPDAAREGVRFAARTMPFVGALERADWSLDKLRRGPLVGVAARAAHEALAAMHDGKTPPVREPGTAFARLALRLLPRVVPFDLERYAAKHFAKTSSQTRLMLADWIELARRRHLPAKALEELASPRTTFEPTIE